MASLLALWISLWIANVASVVNVIPNTFTINMDLPVDVRLKPICEEYKQYAEEIYQHVISVIPAELVNAMEDIMFQWFIRNAVEPYRSEIHYFATCADIPLGAIVTVNLVYDMTVSCTGIVAEDENGNIYHGRNLDYGELPLLRNSTYVAIYTNNNSDILYTGTPFFGYAGLWTGYKQGHNGFSLQGDTRHGINQSIVDNIVAIHDDYWPSGWLIRDTLMNQGTFDQALQRLNSTKIMAPVYYIMGGAQYPEGAVISRDQKNSYNLWMLKDSYLGWYQVETNYDWWTPAPTWDDRRDHAIASMNEMGQANLNQMNLFDVMSKYPVMDLGTIYTVIMSVSNQSVFYIRVRYHEV